MEPISVFYVLFHQSGMIRTSSDLFFVQPLPAHLAKRVRRSADYAPHLIYRLSPGKADARGCETKISGEPVTFWLIRILTAIPNAKKKPGLQGHMSLLSHARLNHQQIGISSVHVK